MKVEEFVKTIKQLNKTISDDEKRYNALLKYCETNYLYIRYHYDLVSKKKGNKNTDDKPVKKISRVVVSKKNGVHSHMCASGYIFDFRTGRLLAHPMAETLKMPVPVSGNWEFYPIIDGTIVNLYYYGDKWCMGTAKGIDVSSHKLFTETTYLEAFEESAKIANYDLTTLNKSNSYTFVFKNSHFHPFLDKNIFELIAKFDLLTYKMTMVQQQIPQINSLNDMLKYHNEQNELFSACCLNNSLKGLTPYYGYILRKNQDGFADILVESDLMKDIRQMFYNLPKNMVFKDSYERRLYVLIKAVCSQLTLKTFNLLFPNYSDELLVYVSIFEEVVKRIYQNGRQMKEIKKTEQQPEDLIAELYINDEYIKKLNMFNSDTISIIRDYILDKNKYLNNIFDILKEV